LLPADVCVERSVHVEAINKSDYIGHVGEYTEWKISCQKVSSGFRCLLSPLR